MFDYITLFVLPVTLPYHLLQFVCCCKKCDLPGWVFNQTLRLCCRVHRDIDHSRGEGSDTLAIALGIKIAVRETSKKTKRVGLHRVRS